MRKIGRNEPCPCGSGKKFKHCHLGKEDELVWDGRAEFSHEMSSRITGLPHVCYGRSGEMIDALDIKDLTGSTMGIKFIDLKKYDDLIDAFDGQTSQRERGSSGGIVVNVLKSTKSDPENIYLAISPGIEEGVLAHQLAHVLDYLAGSKLMPGVTKALSFDLGIPVEHLEHPHEYGYWLDYLKEKFEVQSDADDTIISYLYRNGMLIKGEDIDNQDRLILKSKSDRILAFLSEKSGEIDSLICELPGYIGSREKKEGAR